jgi:hypothetical protein
MGRTAYDGGSDVSAGREAGSVTRGREERPGVTLFSLLEVVRT